MKTKTLLILVTLSFVFLLGCNNNSTTKTTDVTTSSTLITTLESTVLTTIFETTSLSTTTTASTTVPLLTTTIPEVTTTTTTQNITTTNITITEELKYNIYLETDGGVLETYTIENISSDTTVTLPIPTKDNFVFGGWYISDKSTLKLTSVTISSSDITVYANWGTEGLEYTLLEDESAYEVSIGEVLDELTIEIPKQYLDKPVTRIANDGFKEVSFMEQIIIPNTITEIGDRAFMGAYDLVNLNFPESLEEIGNTVFRNCYNLESFSVDENNESFKAVDGVLLSKDETVLIRYPQNRLLTTYVVPESVIIIREDAFGNNNHLISVEIGSNVTTILDHAFYNCPNITTFTIPDNVTSVGIYLFRNSGLQEIHIGSGLTAISSYMFNNCASLESIVIPSNISSIGYGAFYDCINLDTLIIMRPSTSGLITGASFMLSFTSSELKIYFVDQGTLTAYETSLYWSSYKSRFEIYVP